MHENVHVYVSQNSLKNWRLIINTLVISTPPGCWCWGLGSWWWCLHTWKASGTVKWGTWCRWHKVIIGTDCGCSIMRHQCPCCGLPHCPADGVFWYGSIWGPIMNSPWYSCISYMPRESTLICFIELLLYVCQGAPLPWQPLGKIFCKYLTCVCLFPILFFWILTFVWACIVGY